MKRYQEIVKSAKKFRQPPEGVYMGHYKLCRRLDIKGYLLLMNNFVPLWKGREGKGRLNCIKSNLNSSHADFRLIPRNSSYKSVVGTSVTKNLNQYV